MFPRVRVAVVGCLVAPTSWATPERKEGSLVADLALRGGIARESETVVPLGRGGTVTAKDEREPAVSASVTLRPLHLRYAGLWLEVGVVRKRLETVALGIAYHPFAALAAGRRLPDPYMRVGGAYIHRRVAAVEDGGDAVEVAGQAFGLALGLGMPWWGFFHETKQRDDALHVQAIALGPFFMYERVLQDVSLCYSSLGCAAPEDLRFALEAAGDPREVRVPGAVWWLGVELTYRSETRPP